MVTITVIEISIECILHNSQMAFVFFTVMWEHWFIILILSFAVNDKVSNFIIDLDIYE